MVKVFHGAHLQMAFQNVFEKGVVLLTDTHLHVDIEHLLQSDHLQDTTIMKGTVIGFQATESIQSVPHIDVTKAHLDDGPLQDMNAGEVRAHLAVQVDTVAVTGIEVGAVVQCGALVQQIRDLL